MRSVATTKAALATLLAGSALVLAACGGGGGGDDVVITPPTPPPAAPKLEDGFGAGFATSFRAVPNSDPRDPVAGDVIAVNAAADPVAIP